MIPGRGDYGRARELLSAMTLSLAHRGPDGSGERLFARPGLLAGLGHRRLSIIDLSERGRQPMENEDGSVAVSFNGEIYNYRDLARDLATRGHDFASRTDTEVLVHLYEEKGADLVEDLSGMFAFALWDQGAKRLILARDRAGIKPLYYARVDGGLYFASEIKALLRVPGFSRRVDEESLDLYMTYGYIPGESTIFAGVKKLPPAGVLTFSDGETSLRRFWQPEYVPKNEAREAELAEALAETLDRAVTRHLVADVPVASFLSGGADSTIVTSLAAAKSPGMESFSLGWEGVGDEREFARKAAARAGTLHHEFATRPEAARMLPRLLWHLDEPFFDNSALAVYQLSALARERVKVVLSGDGGDELFGGYEWTRRDQLRQGFSRLPGPVRRAGCAALSRALPPVEYDPSPRARGGRMVGDLCSSMEEGFLRRTSVSPAFRQSLYTPELSQRLAGFDSLEIRRSLLSGARVEDPRDGMLHADFSSFLPEDCLFKVDRMSMAHGLEIRVPLLDPEVVDFAMRLPYGKKIRGLTSKFLLKKAFENRVPRENLYRHKQGFTVPVSQWLKNELHETASALLLSDRARGRGWFAPQVVAKMLSAHQSGSLDLGHRLWSLVVLEAWARLFLDQNTWEPPEAALEDLA